MKSVSQPLTTLTGHNQLTVKIILCGAAHTILAALTTFLRYINITLTLPQLKADISAYNRDINSFADVDDLYKEGLLKFSLRDEGKKNLPLPKMVTKMQESSQGLLKYQTPKVVSRDKYAWLRDDEFARQTLAGVNIERVTVFPPVSKLDPEIYGPQESALKEEHIASQLNGMTVQHALKENKLFVLDYHDLYLPFLDKINALA
ncbi:hypothetical protein HRI_002274500 [Hibiscus trionum]|uniref:Lipoxygenase domain-containing protein n=1 Tax=Hibiscus trionum TaxID=183268 RepID=A0A9W7HZU6_HIBTR|nr:hypothetical protein HRI_002274500 [Hibiscus trionum]